MFLNRLCWWTSILSFAVFAAGFVALMGVFFVPIPDMMEWTLRLLGPIVGCAVLAHLAADFHEVEEVDTDAPTVAMDAGNIASGVLAAVIGSLITALCGIGSYHLFMGVLFA